MEKKYEILNYLCSKDAVVTSTDIQEVFNVSRRSIINYVKQLNEELPAIIQSSKDGYFVRDKEKAITLLNENSSSFQYEGYEKRKTYILEKLLLKKEDTTIYQLAEELYVSDLTISKDIVKLKKELSEKGLYINSKHDRLFIVGDTRKKNKYLLNMLNNELENSRFSFESLQDFFEIADIAIIREIVTKNLKPHMLSLDDYSLLNYVLHIAVCVETNQTSIVGTSRKDLPFPPHFETIIKEIYTDLKKAFPGSTFTQEQIFDASILMSTRVISSEISSLSFTDIKEYVGEDVYELIIKIILGIYRNYGLDVNVDDFTVRFAFHIKNLVIRINNQLNLTSSSFISIKNDYPFLYTIALYISSLIDEKYHTVLPENEISYIALHLGVLMENKREKERLISCSIVAYDYYHLGKNLYETLHNSIKDLTLNQIVSDISDVDTENSNLVITTFEPNYNYAIPQVQVGLIPTDNDIENVANKVKELQKRIKQNEIIKKYRKFFDEKLTYIGTTFNSKNDIIDTMCSNLVKYGFVTSEFRDEIYKHEAIMPSEYGNIAIPHPLSDSDDHVKKSSISLWISEKPIKWDNNVVNMVFMISLLPQDKPLFSEIFNSLTKSVKNKVIIENAFKANSFSSLIETLLNI